MATIAEAIKAYLATEGCSVTRAQIVTAINTKYPGQWKATAIQAHLYGCAINTPKAYKHHPYAEKFLFKNPDGTIQLYAERTHGPNKWSPTAENEDARKSQLQRSAKVGRRASQAASINAYPMPTVADLREARDEFKRIEPRDFFYWSVTKLTASVLDAESRVGMVDELVRALMMLLTTWNKNYYRFFSKRNPGMTLEEHFGKLEEVISRHFECLSNLRRQRLEDIAEIPEQDIRQIFKDFSDVLGRVGAAKCLHLLAPRVLPLWDAAILKGYGLENGEYRGQEDEDRYIAFIRISKAQIDNLGDFAFAPDNPLKCLDEYNYCCFTKKVRFD